jgi:lysyl-tRNA synthetase class 2
MERQQVASTNIRSIGFAEASGTLEIEFHGGGVYQYLNVPEMVYAALMNAPSKGRYLNDHIKNRYQCRKIS